MASTGSMQSSGPSVATGNFTSASTAAAEVITIGFDPTWFVCVIDMEATNPDVVISVNGATSSGFITGSTGAITGPANEVTYNDDGTVTLSATPQNDDGVNYWFAIR